MLEQLLANVLLDAGTYSQRKVGLLRHPHGFVSTARVSDGVKLYETAVQDDRYIMGDSMCIVENYDTLTEAQAGHTRWCAVMSTDGQLPQALVDCGNGLGGLTKELDLVYERIDMLNANL